jgi:Protein of unknown function (DUF2490)
MKKPLSISGAIGALLFSLTVFGSVRAQNPNAVNEFDPTVEVRIELPRHVRLDFTFGREKSEVSPSGKLKLDVGMNFRLMPILRRILSARDPDSRHRLVFAANYDYSRAKEAQAVISEHKLILDGTLRQPLPNKYLLSDRNRFEFRWVNGQYRFRYRNRLRLERPVTVLKKEVTPYIAAEAFWDSRPRKFNQFRYSTGVSVPLRGPFSMNMGYERQHCTTCSDVNVNVVEVALIITFRLKKR